MTEYGEGEGPAFSEWSSPRARKRHRCYECRLEVKPGERYHVLSGRWEYGFDRFKYCASCKRWADGALFILKLEFYPLGLLSEAIAELTDQGGGEHYVERRPRV